LEGKLQEEFLKTISIPEEHLSAIAYGVGHINGVAGLEAWRWLFLIEGIPSGKCPQSKCCLTDCNKLTTFMQVIMGVLVFLFMPNYPERAGWLTEAEKRMQRQRLHAGNNSHGQVP
jgi:hypothetical protein